MHGVPDDHAARPSDGAPVIGRSIRRLEDRRLVSGQGTYVDDLRVPGALHVAIVRSAQAHGRIVGIDVSDAPAGVTVVTAADLGADNGPFPHPTWSPPAAELVRRTGAAARPETIHLLAADVVRYVGEPVAAVIAEDRYVAEDVARALAVGIDPLPVVVDPRDALAMDAPLLHPEWGTNVAGTFRIVKGDPDAAFEAADHVVRIVVAMPRQTGTPIEPRGVLVRPEPDGSIVVWSSTQAPHWLRDALVTSLGERRERIRVIAPDVGGGFGTKSMVYPEELLLPLLARRLRRPLRWTDTRTENFLASVQSRSQEHAIELALGADGTFLAVRDRYLVDGGASNVEGFVVPYNTAAHLQGPYRIAALDLACTIVLTNKQPLSAYRGAGRPEAAFAMERVVDQAARELGLDRVELRRRNTLRLDEMPYDAGITYRDGSPLVMDAGDLIGCLDAAVAAIGAGGTAVGDAPRDGKRRGIGIAAYVEGTGIGPEEWADVHVESSGGVTVRVGVPSQGQGHATILAQLAADELALAVDRITVLAGDTEAIPEAGATIASRTAVVVGNAVARAAATVRELALDQGSELLEAARQDVHLEDGAVRVVGSPASAVGLEQVAASLETRADGAGPSELRARESFRPPSVTFSNGVHAALVAVDPEIGEVRVERYVVAHDCGRVINPRILEGQIVGGVVQGLGGALLEELIHSEDGQLLNGTFMDYGLPRSTDTPSVEVIHLETPSARNPLGIKGAGEAGTIAVAAAVASAVEEALRDEGVVVTSVPLTPERVLELIASARRADRPPRQEGAVHARA
jgi:carbon-monoxide dehydrogenase large subunit